MKFIQVLHPYLDEKLTFITAIIELDIKVFLKIR